jgi:hypothetical protein
MHRANVMSVPPVVDWRLTREGACQMGTEASSRKRRWSMGLPRSAAPRMMYCEPAAVAEEMMLDVRRRMASDVVPVEDRGELADPDGWDRVRPCRAPERAQVSRVGDEMMVRNSPSAARRSRES